MLRLNHRSISRTAYSGVESVRMSAVFDDITKTGAIMHSNSQRFVVKDNLLTLNGTQHQLSELLDLNAEPEELIAYFNQRFGSAQPDMFLEPPQSKGGNRIPMFISELRWEYPDMTWRAIDKGGTVAYFERRPVLDKAGFWVSASEGVMPRYGKSLCVTDNYKRSLMNANERK